MTGDVDDDLVFERVQACLANLVAGSGHLASYDLYRESFVVTDSRELDDGCAEYEFAVDGLLISEFTDVSGETSADDGDAEHLTGRVVLDASGELALDADGRARVGPWRVLDPALWPDEEPFDVLEWLDETRS